MTFICVTVRDLTKIVEGCGHRLYVDNFFSSPNLFDDLIKNKINNCGTAQPDMKRMSQEHETKIEMG
jgi:hypothetical protein